MIFNKNVEIETLLNGKNGLGIPVAFMFYEGNADTFVTYMVKDTS